MEEKKIQIRQLLENALLVKKERKAKILKELESYSESKLDKIIQILQKAKAQEPKALEEVAQKKPELAGYVKKLQQKKYLADLHEKEKAETLKEIEIIHELEKELEDIDIESTGSSKNLFQEKSFFQKIGLFFSLLFGGTKKM